MDERRLTPATGEITITPHSVERFRERVRPGLGFEAARAELRRLVAEIARVSDAAPEWLTRTMRETSPFYATIGDAVVLPLKPSGGGWVATTCISRGHISALARERRNRFRQARARRRRVKREGGRRSERRRTGDRS